jgi:hypothetical protein
VNAVGLTKEDVLRKIPMMRRKEQRLPRPQFRDFHRMLNSYVYTEAELKLLDAQIVALVDEGDFKYED